MNELDQYLEIVNNVLIKSAVKINKWRENFMFEVLLLYLIIPGRINFLQLGRMVVLVNNAIASSSVVSLTGCHSMPPWLNLD
jgi:hypothetical protein